LPTLLQRGAARRRAPLAGAARGRFLDPGPGCRRIRAFVSAAARTLSCYSRHRSRHHRRGLFVPHDESLVFAQNPRVMKTPEAAALELLHSRLLDR
jgi:hypothetical protein